MASRSTTLVTGHGAGATGKPCEKCKARAEKILLEKGGFDELILFGREIVGKCGRDDGINGGR